MALKGSWSLLAPSRSLVDRLPVSHQTLIFILSFIAFVSLGFPDAVLGVAWPSLRDAFDLRCTFERVRPVTRRGLSPLQHGAAERRDVTAQYRQKGFGARVGLRGARFGERTFRVRAVEQRK